MSLQHLPSSQTAPRTDSPASPSRESFLPLFKQKYEPLLDIRASGFLAIFELLEARCAQLGRPALIVETGCMRGVGNWAGDGQSTLLWKEFAALHPCEVHTVDIDPAAVRVVREVCGDAVQAHVGDSVEFLYELANQSPSRQIDLLYLDSSDFDPNNPFPSAMHHVKELIAARPCLGTGSMVVIADNYVYPDPTDGRITGKGSLALQWFRHLDIPLIHKGHQFVWQL
jgi:predicted RNA methylase